MVYQKWRRKTRSMRPCLLSLVCGQKFRGLIYIFRCFVWKYRHTHTLQIFNLLTCESEKPKKKTILYRRKKKNGIQFSKLQFYVCLRKRIVNFIKFKLKLNFVLMQLVLPTSFCVQSVYKRLQRKCYNLR